MASVSGLVYFVFFAAVIPEGAAFAASYDGHFSRTAFWNPRTAFWNPVFIQSDECYDMDIAGKTGQQVRCNEFTPTTPTGLCRSHGDQCTIQMSAAYGTCWNYFRVSKGYSQGFDPCFCEDWVQYWKQENVEDLCNKAKTGKARVNCEIQRMSGFEKFALNRDFLFEKFALNRDFFIRFSECLQSRYNTTLVNDNCKQCSYNKSSSAWEA